MKDFDGTSERAPCGCLIGNANDVFFINPCSPTCNVYAYAITEARKAGKPVTTVDLSDSGRTESFVPRCPHCQTVNDGWSGARGSKPKPGSLSLCAYCFGWSFFGDDDLRKPTRKEARIIANDPDLCRTRSLIMARLNLGNNDKHG